MHVVLLTGWLIVLNAWMFADTLRLPYYSDDFDHLHVIAEVRAGLRPALDLTLGPHNEQTLVLMRLVLWLGSWLSGLDCTAARIIVVGVHALGALACGLIAFWRTHSRAALWLAATLYAAAGGFIASIVWCVSNAIFLLGGVAFAWALAALAAPLRNRWVAGAASLCFGLLACLGINGAALALLAVPVFCWLTQVSMPASLSRLSLMCFLLAAGVLLAARWNLARAGTVPELPVRAALETWLWFIWMTPVRFLESWTPYHTPLAGWLGWTAAAVAWALLLASLRLVDPVRRRLVLALWIGPVLLNLLVAAGRSFESQATLYWTDRYYYFYLLPLVVHVTLLTQRSRVMLSAVVILLGVGAWCTRLRVRASVPWSSFEFSARAVAAGRDLLHLIRVRAAAGEQLVLADGPIPLDGVHKGRISLACLLYTEFPRGLDRVRMAAAPLTFAQAAVQNDILDEWAQRIRLPSSPVASRKAGSNRRRRLP